MTINEIYADYTPGSQGFAIAVETHCGYNISRDEIKRIGSRAVTPDEFQKTWENDDWWTDGKNENAA